MRDFYKILGVSATADATAIRKAYKRLALIYHPDINKAPDAQERFIELNEAYETLSNPGSRFSYDIALKAYHSPHQSPPKAAQPAATTTSEKSNYSYYWLIGWIVIAALRSFISNIGSNNDREHFHNENVTTELPSFMQDSKPKASMIMYNPSLPGGSNALQGKQ